MILDNLSTLADGVALSTSGTGRQVVGSQYDLGTTGRNVGAGKPIYLFVRVATAFTSGGSATVTFEIVSDASAALATDGSSTLHLTTSAIPVATLTAGYVVYSVAIPQNVAFERYLGIVANVGTAALTAGAIDAFITFDPPEGTWKAYADASN